MSISLGSNQVNKAYLGTTEIQKMYLGADLVFDNSIQPSELTPILTNFRVEQFNANYILFDAPLGYPDGLTTAGFEVSGKSVSSVVKTSDISGFFIVSVDFNFWDNNTIRLGENTDTSDVNLSLHNFTLEDIVNNIDEPASTIDRYVTNVASGSGNGTNDTDQAWTLSQAQTGVAPGTTVWVKVGNYGSTVFTPNSTGTISNPVKWIGYKTVKGDITENYLSSYNGVDTGISTDWDVNEMPTLSGASTVYTEAAIRLESSYNIIRNFQTTGWGSTMVEYDSNLNYIVIDNFNSKDNYSTTDANFGGIVLTRNTGLTYLRLKNIVLLNHSMAGIALQGDSADFNLMENVKSYSDRTQELERQDYHISFNGNNTIVKDCYVENFNDTETNGSTHGIGIKATGNVVRNDYNLITRCESVNQQECYYFRNYDVRESVIKDSIGRGNGSTSNQDCGGVWFWGGVRRNVIERVIIKDMTFCGIGLYDNAESPTWNEIGEDNTIRNCIFDNVKFGIYSDSSGETSEFNNNYFYNNTFTGITQGFYSHQGTGTVPITNLQIYNNIIEDCASAGTSGLSGFVFDYNTFWNSWTTGIGANDINENPNLTDYLPNNEALYVDGYPNLYYDLNKKERTTPKSTIGAVTLVSEQAGGDPVVTADYYVSNSGLDTNPGTELEPWQTLNKVKNTAFSAGEIIAFERGGIWAETETFNGKNGASGNEILFTAYGSGAKPIITAVHEYNLTWTSEGGNIWSTNEIDRTAVRLKIDGLEVLGGSEAELGTSIPDLVQFYSSGSVFKIYSLDNPEDHVLEFSSHEIDGTFYNIALGLTNSSYLKFENIEFRGGYFESINIATSDNITFDACSVGDMSNRGMYVVSSTNIEVTNSDFDTKYTLDYSGGGTSTSSSRGGSDGIQIRELTNGLIHDSTFKNWSHSSYTLTSNSQEVITNVKAYNNNLSIPDLPYGGAAGMDGLNTYGNEYYNNTYDGTKGVQFNGHDNHFHDNTVINIKDSPIHTPNTGEGLRLQNYYEGCYNNIIEDNIFTNCSGAGIFVSGNNSGDVTDNIIRRNVITNCGIDEQSNGIRINTDSSTGSNYGNSYIDNEIINDTETLTIMYRGGLMTVSDFNAANGGIENNTITGNTDGQLVNLVTEPYDLTAAVWNKIGGTITGTTEATPSGSNDGCVLTASAGNGTCRYTTEVLEAATQYNLTYWYKNIDSTEAKIFIYDTLNGVSLFSQTLVTVTTEYQEYSFNFTTTDATTVYLDVIREVDASGSAWDIRLTKV